MSRCTYVYRPGDPNANERGMVDASIAGAPPDDEKHAINAGIMSGRFYENTKTQDGQDIGSRKKLAEYKKREGVELRADYGESWFKKHRKQRTEFFEGRYNPDRAERRETIARVVHELEQRGKR